ncbi:hypothetical protein E3P86_01081 [Wallemia ichthyophaga]|uniref:DH domain-containing protein n=1 Tax=Wallemia ichthyophaga TaxID=245174 RepID=A0A4T0J9F0_WALIC|nr:hypothetical protein E3P86_01081 [Wallemia ichthyophaga]
MDKKYKSPLKSFKKLSNIFDSNTHQQIDVFAQSNQSKALYPDHLRRAKSLDSNQAKKNKVMSTQSRVRNRLRKSPKEHVEQDQDTRYDREKYSSSSATRSRSKDRVSRLLSSRTSSSPAPPVPQIPQSTHSSHDITHSFTTISHPSEKAQDTTHRHSYPPKIEIPTVSPFSKTLEFVPPNQNWDQSEAFDVRTTQRKDPYKSPAEMLGLKVATESPTTLPCSSPSTPTQSYFNHPVASPQTLHMIADDNLFYEALKDFRKRSIVFGTADSDVVASLCGKGDEKSVVSPTPSPTASTFDEVSAREDQIMSDPAWKSEVKRLFIIREIASTERSYAKYLTQLLDLIKTSYPSFQTQPTTSIQIIDENGSKNPEESFKHIELLAKHLPELIALSNQLSQRMDDDPSAYGVAVAFISLKTDLESVFVNWSRVYPHVLNSIMKNKSLREQMEKRNKRGKSMSFVETSKTSSSEHILQSPHETVESYTTNKKGRVKTEPTRATNEKALTKKKKQKAIEESLEKLTMNESQVHQRLRLNDVAVMPSQRVTRYVLLLKDLSKHTPETALARGLIDGALKGAQSVAYECNKMSSKLKC